MPLEFYKSNERWQSPDKHDINSCTVVTTEPNDIIRPYHNRMPVILSELQQEIWLNHEISEREPLESLLSPSKVDLTVRQVRHFKRNEQPPLDSKEWIVDVEEVNPRLF